MKFVKNLATYIEEHQRAIAYTCTAAYFFFFCFATINSHYGLKTSFTDLGVMARSIWAVLDGDLLMINYFDRDPVIENPRLKNHVNAIFYLIAPLYAVVPRVETLLVLTSLACALGGLGVYFIARKTFGGTWEALVPAMFFWLNPFTQDANLYGFHVITIAAACIIWSIWAFLEERNRLGYILLALAMLCKEDVPLVTFCLGLAFILSKRYRIGIPIAVVSVAYFIFLTHLVQPSLNISFASGFSNPTFKTRYEWLGKTPAEMALGAFTNPMPIIQQVLEWNHGRSIIFLFFAGALAALPGWRFLLLMGPQIAIGVLSNTAWSTRMTGTYYWVVCGAAIAVAFAIGTPKCGARYKAFAHSYFIAITLLLSFVFSPLPYSIRGAWGDILPVDIAESKTFEKVKELIPEDAKVAAQNNVGAHFPNRKFIGLLNDHEADFRIYFIKYMTEDDLCLSARADHRHNFGIPPQKAIDNLLKKIRDPNWGVLFSKNGFFVLKKYGPDSVSRERALLNLQTYLLDYNYTKRINDEDYKKKHPFKVELCKWLG